MRKLLLISLLPLLFPLALAAQTADPSQPANANDTPTPSGAAFQAQRQGVFDCNQNGAYAMSVGALSAIGGAYVPVADAAVELNTGILVYKECVLREVVVREREAASTAFLKQMYSSIQQGRGGNPMYVQNEGKELVSVVYDPTELAFLQDTALWDNVHPELQAPLKRASAQFYEGERSGLQATSLKCPYSGSLKSYWAGQAYNSGTFFADFFNASAPQCNPVLENAFLFEISSGRTARNELYQMNEWNRGNSFYARTNGELDPAKRLVLTPSYTVSQSFQQILGSPIRQLESANDIGQMIGALYAGVTTQITGDVNGLAGLAKSVGGQPSYLDQVAKESQQGLRGAAINAALNILNAQQQIESAYYQYVSGSGQQLSQAQTQLRAAEGKCWDSLISKVCATSLKADKTCTAVTEGCTTDPVTGVQTCPTGATLKVATSTAFSQAVIDSQITPLVAPVTQAIDASRAALQLLNTLIQGIVNTASLDAQRVALQQLDTLVAQKKLHTQTSVQTASQQTQSITTTMQNLLQTVAQNWGGTNSEGTGNFGWDGTTSPGVGWCNVNNSATREAWIQKWKK